MKSLQTAIVFFAFLIPLTAYGWPLPKIGERFFQLPEGFTTAHDFEGIVALSNCSGSLIRLEHAKDTDSAWVLTNGHCLETGFPAAGQIIYKRSSNRRFAVLNSEAVTVGYVRAKQIVYGTMTKTDMGLYQLEETYADIAARYHIRPLQLASTHPQQKDPIEVISGYWRRGYSCQIEQFVYKLVEGQWTSEDSIRYSRPGCEVIGGTSGSPIVLQGTRTVIGVNNTGNEEGEKCTDDNPCEVSPDGSIFYRKGYSYGQQTYWIYSCLDANGTLDVSVRGCELFH